MKAIRRQKWGLYFANFKSPSTIEVSAIPYADTTRSGKRRRLQRPRGNRARRHFHRSTAAPLHHSTALCSLFLTPCSLLLVSCSILHIWYLILVPPSSMFYRIAYGVCHYYIRYKTAILYTSDGVMEQWSGGKCRMRSISSDIFRRQQNDGMFNGCKLAYFLNCRLVFSS